MFLLENRSEVCDIYVQEILPAVPAAINEWETVDNSSHFFDLI